MGPKCVYAWSNEPGGLWSRQVRLAIKSGRKRGKSPASDKRTGLVGSALKLIACGIALIGSCHSGITTGNDLPNETLPKEIRPEPGKVTLFADYSARGTNGSIPVYLINAGTKEISLSAQDGDVYLKLEVADLGDHWVRAQPHAFSWCGNSYFDSPRVRSGHFIKIDGYQPTNGETQRIRFALHQEMALTSNTGRGLASPRDADLASRDAMAVQEGTFEFVSRVALGETRLTNEMDHMKDLQEVAIRTLPSPRFNPVESRRVLAEVLKRFPQRKDDVESAMRNLKRRAEPGSAANRSQPVRSETNRTSTAAGSRR